MMMTDWYLEGNRHRCVCGSIWTDADGCACHYRCEECDTVVVWGDDCECTTNNNEEEEC